MAEPPNTPIPSGGAKTALDMSNERDRGMLRQAAKNTPARFRKITPELRDLWVDDLELARKTCKDLLVDEKGDAKQLGADLKLDISAEIRSCIRTGAVLDAMNQGDEHQAQDIARGKGVGPTFVQVNFNQCPPKRPPNLLLPSSSNGQTHTPHRNGSSTATPATE